MWRMSLHYISRPPLVRRRVWARSAAPSAFTFGYGRLWVDNFYLQLAAEGGLLLLALLLVDPVAGDQGPGQGHGCHATRYPRALWPRARSARSSRWRWPTLTASVWETLAVGRGVLVPGRAGHVGGAARAVRSRRGEEGSLRPLRVLHVIGGRRHRRGHEPPAAAAVGAASGPVATCTCSVSARVAWPRRPGAGGCR